MDHCTILFNLSQTLEAKAEIRTQSTKLRTFPDWKIKRIKVKSHEQHKKIDKDYVDALRFT